MVDHPAILSGTPCIDPDGSADLLFVRCHDVHKVADGLCGVVAFADVDVDPASAAWAALCSCLAEQPDNLLQGFDVVVGEDRGDQFAFFCVRSVDAHIPLEFPNPALSVLASPAVISVLAGSVPCSGSEVLGNLSCRFFSGDVVHLDLNSDGLVLHGFNLLSCFIVHGMFSFVFFLVFPFGMCILPSGSDNSKDIKEHIFDKYEAE